MNGLVPLDPQDPHVRALLAEQPAASAKLLELLAHEAPPIAPNALWGHRTDGRLTGVAWLEGDLHLLCCDEAAEAAFAARAHAWLPLVEGVLGNRDTVARFVERAAAAVPQSARVRDYVLMIRAPMPLAQGRLRVATRQDLQAIAAASAAMMREESGVDPLAEPMRQAFLGHTAYHVAAGRYRIFEREGAIAVSFCVTALAPETAQIGAVYTLPALRGRGYATQALEAFLHELHTTATEASLRVLVDNTPARALYDKLGFRSVGLWRECTWSPGQG